MGLIALMSLGFFSGIGFFGRHPYVALFCFFFLLILIGFLFQSWIHYAVQEPLREITALCESLARGRFDQRLPRMHQPFSRLALSLNRLAIRLEHNRRQIEKLEKLRIEFVSNVSHELKTPLTSIHGYTETLLSTEKPDAQNYYRFLNKIKKNSERLEFLISDLLELSKFESQKDLIHPVSFEARVLFEKVHQFFEEKLIRKKHTLTLHCAPKVTVTADMNRIEQVLINLVDNAIKYTPEDTEIQLRLEREDSLAKIVVSDNGQGIPDEHLNRIFERFYRVDRARSRSLGGTGLGLAIVKHIVQAHGGSVDVSSKAGVGTSFTINLPQGRRALSEPKEKGTLSVDLDSAI
jgi:signal transduction histidine kinase